MYWLTKKVEKMALVTLALVIMLDDTTVFLNDGWFIAEQTLIELTALQHSLAVTIGQKSIIERLLGHAISLGSQQWVTLSFCLDCVFYFSVYSISSLPISFQKTSGQFQTLRTLGSDFIFLIIQTLDR